MSFIVEITFQTYQIVHICFSYADKNFVVDHVNEDKSLSSLEIPNYSYKKDKI